MLALVEKHVAPGGRVLDVGAGSGAFSRRLQDHGYRVVATDIDSHAWRASGVPFVATDTERGLAQSIGEPFDAVCCLEVMEHVENPWQLARELARLLCPGGIALISTPNVSSFLSRVRFLRTGRFHQFQERDRDYGHVRPITDLEMRTLLQRAGLEVREVLAGGYLPVFDLQLAPSEGAGGEPAPRAGVSRGPWPQDRLGAGLRCREDRWPAVASRLNEKVSRHKIAILVSWYPSRRSPIVGRFMVEQAEAIAEQHDVALVAPVRTWWRDLWRGLPGRLPVGRAGRVPRVRTALDRTISPMPAAIDARPRRGRSAGRLRGTPGTLGPSGPRSCARRPAGRLRRGRKSWPNIGSRSYSASTADRWPCTCNRPGNAGCRSRRSGRRPE